MPIESEFAHRRTRLGDAPHVPDWTAYDVSLGAFLHTGSNAVGAVQHLLVSPTQAHFVALDIEARGLGAKSFDIRCVTASWELGGDIHAVCLDPRREDHAEAIARLTRAAEMLILHNAAYDVPPLVWYGLLAPEQIHAIWDTVVCARMAFPDVMVKKDLASLACRRDLLHIAESAATMKDAFTAYGASTTTEGWETMDIDSPVYRLGAMADTVVTLRLARPITNKAIEWLTSNPLMEVTIERAQELLLREQIVNRVMLTSSARGLKVDTAYLQEYSSQHEEEREHAFRALSHAGLDPEAGNVGAQLVEALHVIGQLPDNWPVTATGRLKADKAAMKNLEDHPLVQAQQKVAELGKISNYLEKVSEYAYVTGRVHPQVGVLGASATGRMSYREPELQQFPHDARGILIPDTQGEGKGWASIDWSAIEPVIVANCAGDKEYLQSFNEGKGDIYHPVVEWAHVERKTAKTILLGAMYGQGIKSLAARLGVSEDEARRVRSQAFSVLPKTEKFLNKLRAFGEQHRCISTADGRLLPIPSDHAGRAQGYRACNYFVQGTAYSVLSETINTLHRQGLAECIRLAMHDELVVDMEVAHDVQKVMQTPPVWLEQFAGHKVTFRTDNAPLPERWAYV